MIVIVDADEIEYKGLKFDKLYCIIILNLTTVQGTSDRHGCEGNKEAR